MNRNEHEFNKMHFLMIKLFVPNLCWSTDSYFDKYSILNYQNSYFRKALYNVASSAYNFDFSNQYQLNKFTKTLPLKTTMSAILLLIRDQDALSNHPLIR